MKTLALVEIWFMGKIIHWQATTKNATKSEDSKAKVKESWKDLMLWLHIRTDRQEPRSGNWIHLSGEGQGDRDKWA